MTNPTNPFDLSDDAAYRTWRDAKLAAHPTDAAELVVAVADPMRLSDRERRAVCDRVGRANMAIYAGPAGVRDAEGAKAVVRAVATAFGLTRMEGNLCADEDGITPLQVDATGRRERYIPYTDKPLNWHTDGYYNPPERRLRAMTLHCVAPAAEGGENGLVDPEIAYILVRDENPAYIKALMHPEAMTIPANAEGSVEIRAEATGPVFSVLDDGTLYMRYSARKRNVRWRDDAATGDAARFLEDTLNGTSPHIIRHRLAAGEGLISNNVLHMRTGFTDSADADARRLMLRGRFYDRVQAITPTHETE